MALLRGAKISSMEDVMTTEMLVKKLDPPKGLDSGLRHMIAAAVSFVSLVVVVLGFIGISRMPENEDTMSRLDGAVLRLMMADELAVDDELQRASENLEFIFTLVGSKDIQKKYPVSQEIFGLAEKIRDALANSDRKSAVDLLVLFREKMDTVDSAAYRNNLSRQDSDLNWTLLSGIFGLLAGVSLFWLSESRSRRRLMRLQAEKSRLEDDLNLASDRFGDERQRTIELQQRLIESNRLIRKIESTLEDYSQALPKLEASVKFLRSALTESDSRVKSMELDLDEKSKAYNDSLGKISSMEAVLDAACRSEETKQAQFNKLVAEKNKELESLLAREEELQRTLERWDSDARQEAEALRSEMAKARVAFDSEFAVVEWSNVKMRTELEELNAEILKLRETIATQSRDARTDLINLRNKLEVDKHDAVRELSERSDEEINLLRTQLRDAMQTMPMKNAL